VANLADLIKGLNETQFETLKRELNASRKLDLVEYIATAHNQPAVARKSAKRWLDNGARLPYHVSATRKGRTYALKTAVNYYGLRGERLPRPHLEVSRKEKVWAFKPVHPHVRKHERHHERQAIQPKHQHHQLRQGHHR
jgi:hypothetical protein